MMFALLGSVATDSMAPTAGFDPTPGTVGTRVLVGAVVGAGASVIGAGPCSTQAVSNARDSSASTSRGMRLRCGLRSRLETLVDPIPLRPLEETCVVIIGISPFIQRENTYPPW